MRKMQHITYPRKSLIIYSVDNGGFIVNTKGTIESQHYEMDGVFVFEDLDGLTDFIIKHYAKKKANKGG